MTQKYSLWTIALELVWVWQPEIIELLWNNAGMLACPVLSAERQTLDLQLAKTYLHVHSCSFPCVLYLVESVLIYKGHHNESIEGILKATFDASGVPYTSPITDCIHCLMGGVLLTKVAWSQSLPPLFWDAMDSLHHPTPQANPHLEAQTAWLFCAEPVLWEIIP